MLSPNPGRIRKIGSFNFSNNNSCNKSNSSNNNNKNNNNIRNNKYINNNISNSPKTTNSIDRTTFPSPSPKDPPSRYPSFVSNNLGAEL